MNITVGTTNKVKVAAVIAMLPKYELFKGFVLTAINVESGVGAQPRFLEETILGAKNRAMRAFASQEDCEYGFGIEGGLMKVPYTDSGYMNFHAVSIFNGENFSLGLTSAFEYPTQVIDMVFGQDVEIDEAFKRCGLTDKDHVGRHEGVVGVLTNKRLVREDYIKQAIMHAMIPWENAQLYMR